MNKLLSAIMLAWVCAPSFVLADEPKRVYIANDDHTDYMWTADADTYARVFVEMLDFHLKLADETASNPLPFRNRFNADGSYWLWEYEQKKTPAEFGRLMGRVKDGTITSPLNTVVSCYGGQPAEAIIRGMYYAGRLERRFDVRFPLALAMEDQTLPRGLASLFAGSGARYSWRGVCGCASKLDKKVLSDRPDEIYWWTGPDDQRLLLKWYSLGPLNIGTYLEAGSSIQDAVKHTETDPGFLRRYVDPTTKEPYRVIGLFGFGGDDLARKTGVKPPPSIPAVPGLQKVVSSAYCDHFHNIARDLTTPERQVIVSNELDFFKDFEARHGATLTSRSVTYGNEWDLYSASMSETSARAKRAVEKLRSAELLATLVSLKYPAFMDRHTAARDRAFNSLGLFWEHNWTADGPISRGQRAAWEELQATTIECYVNSIYAEGIIRLGGMIPRPANASRFFVLNPLGWARNDYADFAYTGGTNIHVRDVSTDRDVPFQFVSLEGARCLRILAADVPPCGYKVYESLAGPGHAPTDDAASITSIEDGVIENGVVKLAVDRDGAIRSFIDKRGEGIELAGSVGGLKLNDLAAGSDAGEPLKVENRGPVSVTLRARSSAGLDHTSAITLYRNSNRVDIRNDLNVNFSDVRYWAFSFAMEGPVVHSEEIGAINLNALKSDGGDYANTHARYDHITVNHFADMTNASGTEGMTLSNPDLAFARLGASTVTSLDTRTPQINLLAGGQVDGRWLGIQDQNGASHFLQRFALRPHVQFDQVAAMKFAMEHQNPLVCGAVISKDGGSYAPEKFSLVSVTDPSVLLWAVKPADEGIDKGVIVRLWNLADHPIRSHVVYNSTIPGAKRTTHIETDIEAVPAAGTGGIEAYFTRQQMQTYRFEVPVFAAPK